MRTVALDIGDVRIGVAISGPSGSVATPLAVLATGRIRGGSRELHDIFVQYDVERIVVGLPITLAGDEGPQARHVRALAAKLLDGVDIPVTFADERLSSQEAKRRMREQGISERDARGSIDKVAAAIFLQNVLDGERAEGNG